MAAAARGVILPEALKTVCVGYSAGSLEVRYEAFFILLVCSFVKQPLSMNWEVIRQ